VKERAHEFVHPARREGASNFEAGINNPARMLDAAGVGFLDTVIGVGNIMEAFNDAGVPLSLAGFWTPKGTELTPESMKWRDALENRIEELGGRDVWTGIGELVPYVGGVSGMERGLVSLFPKLGTRGLAKEVAEETVKSLRESLAEKERSLKIVTTSHEEKLRSLTDRNAFLEDRFRIVSTENKSLTDRKKSLENALEQLKSVHAQQESKLKATMQALNISQEQGKALKARNESLEPLAIEIEELKNRNRSLAGKLARASRSLQEQEGAA